MSRTAPPALPRCTCRHIVTTHAINGKGQRTVCSASDCDCKLFVSAKAVNGG